MAQTSNVRILSASPAERDTQYFPVTIATSGTIAPGDLVTFESTTIDLVDAAGDNVYFVGVSMQYKVSTYDDNGWLNVLLRGSVNIGVSETTYAPGQILKYKAGANGTSWVLEKATSGADGIMWSLEYQASNVSTLDGAFDSFLIGTGAGSGAGFWESPAA
jgi:hypothetical protein